MKKIITVSVIAAFAALFSANVSAQQMSEEDIQKIIEKSVENIDRYVHLDDVQLFFLDSIYRFNIPAMYKEMEDAKAAGSSNQETYIAISDIWMAKCDDAIEKILSKEQWQKYLKCGYGRERKQREKRAALRDRKIRK